jgi:3-deoxy-7-phosphoheptulonate synthase
MSIGGKKMIIIMKKKTSKKDIDYIIKNIKKLGLKPLYLPGVEKIVIGAIGDERILEKLQLESLPFIERVIPILKPYKLVSREFKEEDTIIDVNGVKIGGKNLLVIAGPCSVESEEQIIETAKAVKKYGAHMLRGGAFKPRSSPYSFQGLGKKGLKLLKKARQITKLPIVTEVLDTSDIPLVTKYADILQVGSRNMQNFRLLKALGKTKKPVMLKRGMSASLEDFLMSAEYILSEGNHNVILCERGIKTFETATRNTLDLNIVPLLKELTHLPVIVDPSHATGIRKLVSPMSKAAVACGADGIMVEVHYKPELAKSDGQQSLTTNQFSDLMKQLKPLAKYMGRNL